MKNILFIIISLIVLFIGGNLFYIIQEEFKDTGLTVTIKLVIGLALAIAYAFLLMKTASHFGII